MFIYIMTYKSKAILTCVPHVYRFVVHSVRIVCFADDSPRKSLCEKVIFFGARVRGGSYAIGLKNLK